jgi:catechol 2,3-dioxygenase-like lactoylglutathione lyase family enzyme
VNDFGTRAVFFVKDAESSLRFYTETLGFSLDWNHTEGGKPFVLQVSLFGIQLILNQTEPSTKDRAGHGRVFIGLDADQVETFDRHIQQKGIQTKTIQWGGPTQVILDLDGNELFVWRPQSKQ